jgi:hypothetical protein
MYGSVVQGVAGRMQALWACLEQGVRRTVRASARFAAVTLRCANASWLVATVHDMPAGWGCHMPLAASNAYFDATIT